jgi:DNA-binding beta-propeller fold protein YncE
MLALPKLSRTTPLAIAAVVLSAAAPAQPGGYVLETDWATLPNGLEWGQVVAIDVDRDGNIYALHRCGADTCVERHEPPLLKLDPSGRILQVWGSDRLVWPHGLHIDRDGFIWVSDGRGIEGKGHQVFKLSPEGEVLLTLGVAGAAGDEPGLLNGPTDIAVATSGDVFVADGHGNNRVVKYSPDGRFILAWGRQGSAPGEFEVPHAIAIDSRGRVLVADRDNNRIQIFDQEGGLLDEWTQFGSPSGFYLAPDDTLWVAHSLGINAGSTRDGHVTIAVPHEDVGAEAGNIEDVAADPAGNIYAGLAGPLGLHRLGRR